MKSIGVRHSPSPQYRSANRLEDYAIMHATNVSWTIRLYELSNMYSQHRRNIIEIIENVKKDDNIQRRESQQNTCILTALGTLNDTLWKLISWEKASFYLNYESTLYSENLISRMANDIVRNLGNLENFSFGYGDQLQYINRSSVDLISCNTTEAYVLYEDVRNVILDAKTGMVEFQNEYESLARDVQTHSLMGSYRYPVDGTKDDYIRWA